MGKKFLRGKYISKWKKGKGLGGAIAGLLGATEVGTEETEAQEGYLQESRDLAAQMAEQGSAYETNPVYQQAMSQLGDIYAQGGYTASEQAQIQQANQQAANFEKSQREAAMQNLAMQGMGGTGLEALNRMQAAQNSATMAGNAASDVAIGGQQRAFGALQGQAAMAGQQASGVDAYNQQVAGMQMGAIGAQAGFQGQQAAAAQQAAQQNLSNWTAIASAAAGAPGAAGALGGATGGAQPVSDDLIDPWA